MSREHVPEAVPAVIADIRLGRVCNATIDLDLNYLTEYTRSRGLEDTDINDLTIEFSATNMMVDAERPHFLQGRYVSEQKKCYIWLYTIALRCLREHENTTLPIERLSERLHQEVAETLAHEVEHYVVDVESGFAKPDYVYLPKVWNAENYRAYHDQPNEVRARSAEGLYDPSRLQIS